MPQDPIPQVGTEVGRQLFNEYVRISKGKPIEDVLSASINMICNCLRQNYGLKSEVESRMKELFGRSMDVLLQHYDSTTGRRRSVVPFDQVVRPNMLIDDDVLVGLGDKRRH